MTARCGRGDPGRPLPLPADRARAREARPRVRAESGWGFRGSLAVVLAGVLVLLVWRRGRGVAHCRAGGGSRPPAASRRARFPALRPSPGPCSLAVLLASPRSSWPGGSPTPRCSSCPPSSSYMRRPRPGCSSRSDRRATSRTTSWWRTACCATATCRLERDYAEGRYRAFHDAPLEPHYRVRGKDGEIYSLHAVGLSLLVLPAYALGGYAGASFFMALLAALLAREIRELVRAACGTGPLAEPRRWIAALSPPLLHYAGLVFTEVPAALRRRPAPLAARGTGPVAVGAGPRAPALAERALRARSRRPGPVTASGDRAVWSERVARPAAGRLGARERWAYHYALYGFFDPRRVYGRRPEFSLATAPKACPASCSTRSSGCSSTRPVLRSPCPASCGSSRRDRARASRPRRSSAVVVRHRVRLAHVARRLQPARALPRAGRARARAPGRGAALAPRAAGGSRAARRAGGSGRARGALRAPAGPSRPRRHGAASSAAFGGRGVDAAPARVSCWPSRIATGLAARVGGRSRCGGALAPRRSHGARLAVAVTGAPGRGRRRVVPVPRAHRRPRRGPARGDGRAGRTRWRCARDTIAVWGPARPRLGPALRAAPPSGGRRARSAAAAAARGLRARPSWRSGWARACRARGLARLASGTWRPARSRTRPGASSRTSTCDRRTGRSPCGCRAAAPSCSRSCGFGFNLPPSGRSNRRMETPRRSLTLAEGR